VVTVTTAVRRPGISVGRLKEIVIGALRRERVTPGTAVSIVLVDDPTIRRLNRRFLGKDRPTDVLSFPLADVGGRARERGRHPSNNPHRLLGEIVISIDRARHQAKVAGHLLRTEVALLAVHGILHLTGYDDRSAGRAAAMDRRQRQILRAVGEEAEA